MVKLEIVPDNQSGDYLLLADGKLLSHFNIEFRHHSRELLESIASEWRAMGPLDSLAPTNVSYSTLFFSLNTNLEWDWKTELYNDPSLLTDSFHLAKRGERVKRANSLLRMRWDELPPALQRQVEALDRQASRWGRTPGGDYAIWPKNLGRLKPLKEFLEKQGIDHPQVYLHEFRCEHGSDATNVNKAVKRYKAKKGLQSYADKECGLLFDDGTDIFVLALPEYSDAMIGLIERIGKEWQQLSQEQRNAVVILHANHGSVVLALLLATGQCSASDYATSVLWGVEGEEPIRHLTIDANAVTQTADDDEEVVSGLTERYIRYIEEHGKGHDDSNMARYRQIVGDANIAVDYLRLCESRVMKLIGAGESKEVEFKSSFRWSFKEGKINEAIKTATLKSIVAFLNSGGGTLLLGVSDDGSPVGIEHDQYRNQDEYRRALASSIRDHIGPRFVDAVKIDFWPVGRHEIITIECNPGSPPEHAFLDDRELYVRQGPMSVPLTGRPLADWLRGH